MRKIALSVLLLVACGPGKTTKVQTKTPSVSADVLTGLSVLTRARPPSAAELVDWSGRLDRGETTLSAYVDHLLTSEAFSKEVAPGLILGDILYGPANHLARWTYEVQSTPSSEGPPIYYLKKPCARRDAVRVHPWWDMKTEVLVCPDSYQPDVWRTTGPGDGVYTCDSVMASPAAGDSRCGCGPNLLRCIRNDADIDHRIGGAHQELRDTVAYVVEHDLAYAALFGGRETFHNREMEMLYRFWQIEAERRSDGSLLANLDDWPTDGKWADRVEVRPGEHAGLLTAHGIVHWVSDRRQRQWVIFERLWCTGPSSVGARPADLLALGGSNFQADKNEGWQELAAQPICTDCHARMDYGFQFFWAFPDPKLSSGHFVPELARNGRMGTLYGRDISDPRGEAELTPKGFADIAMRQPEFARCMARNMTEHVFGTDALEDDVRALAERFDPARVTVKQLARTTLLRWAERAQSDGLTPAAPAATRRVAAEEPPPSTGSDPIPLSSQLREAIDSNCGGCHFSGVARLQSFEGEALSRDVLIRMLSQVSAERMPKDKNLHPDKRLALIDLLAAHVWRGASDRQAVHHNLGGASSAAGTWRWSLVQGLIRRAAGAPEASGQPWNAHEAAIRGNLATYTPGVATMSAIEALDACKAAGHKEGAALERCVLEATRPRRLLR